MITRRRWHGPAASGSGDEFRSQAVRFTRHGRPLAVMPSESEFERLCAPRDGLLAFASALRGSARRRR